MKKILITLISLIAMLSLVLACSDESKKTASIERSQNLTPISDSVYYFFDLDCMDTLQGFHEFFKDSFNVALVENYYHKIIDSEMTDPFDHLFGVLWLRAAVIDLVYNLLILSQKMDPLITGRHTGTMNSALLSLRPNNAFDIHWTGWWLNSNLYQGTYRQVSDTLFLSFETERPERVRDTMIMQEDRIAPLNNEDFHLVNFFLPN